MMYAPMKNLSRPLPNANIPSFRASVEESLAQTSLIANRMPRPHPLRSISSPTGYRNGDNELRGGWKDLQIVENDPMVAHCPPNSFSRDDDQESIIRFVPIYIYFGISINIKTLAEVVNTDL